MSDILGTTDAYREGLVTRMPSGWGEEPFDALQADVIPQGVVLWNDANNATPSARGFKKVGTAGAETGPFLVSTKAKAAGEVKVVAVFHDFEVTVRAGATIPGNSDVKPSAVTAGRVDKWVAGTDDPKLKIGRYIRHGKYSNSGDGNHAVGQAVVGDVIVIKLY
jgi:hypothetical protein